MNSNKDTSVTKTTQCRVLHRKFVCLTLKKMFHCGLKYILCVLYVLTLDSCPSNVSLFLFMDVYILFYFFKYPLIPGNLVSVGL